MSTPIVYEHPLSERIRVFLRLEYFFLQAQHFKNAQASWDSQAGISTIIEILSILDRTDVRSEILKELERNINNLLRLQNTANIDKKRLDSTLDKLNMQAKKMQQITTSKSGSICRDSDLLTNIRQRTAISGGTCGFDIPAYHYWLHQPSQVRTETLTHWLNEFRPLQEGIYLLLHMLRTSTFFEQKNAIGGVFQQALDPLHPCQLLRIALPVTSGVYPEVSGNKHRINIRFLSFPNIGRAKQMTNDVEFDICYSLI